MMTAENLKRILIRQLWAEFNRAPEISVKLDKRGWFDIEIRTLRSIEHVRLNWDAKMDEIRHSLKRIAFTPVS